MKEEFLSHLKYLSNDDKIALNKASLDKPIQGLLLDEEKLSPEEIEKIFPYLKPHPFVKNAYIYSKNDYSPGKHYLFEMGGYVLLDSCALMANYFLNPTEEDIYLDCCSAPGGKSLHASFMMHNKGLIISNEISPSRANILKSQVEKYGRVNIIVSQNDILSFPPSYNNTFTKILLDAPCSSSSMFRKEEKMEEDWTYEKVLSLSAIQKRMILKAYDLLAPGGHLLYSTCSFSQEEDEDVIAHLLKNTDAILIELPKNPMFYEGTIKGTIHLFPFMFQGEGHFFSLISKPNKQERNYLKKRKDEVKLSNFSFENNYIYLQNNVYKLTSFKEDISSLNIIKYGLNLGTLDKKLGFIYDHNLSRFSLMLNKSISLSLNDSLLYLEGHPLKLNINDGYYVLSYKHLSFAITKVSKGIAKNHYPKGLRRKFNP